MMTIDSRIGFYSLIGIDSLKGIDSLYGIDSLEELIPYETIPFSVPSKEWEFIIPSFEEWVLLYYRVTIHGGKSSYTYLDLGLLRHPACAINR